jgi:hypothetical protein
VSGGTRGLALGLRGVGVLSMAECGPVREFGAVWLLAWPACMEMFEREHHLAWPSGMADSCHDQ